MTPEEKRANEILVEVGFDSRQEYGEPEWRHATETIAAAIREAVEAERQKVRYCHAEGQTFSYMQDKAATSPLYQHGDMVLVWVNEGDIIEHGEAIEARSNDNGSD